MVEERQDLSIGNTGWSLPELSFDSMREHLGYVAERKLIIAVLEDAIMCYQKYMFAKTAQERRIFDQAELWLMRRDRKGGGEESFSFEFICDALGLNADALREELRRWRQRDAEPFVSSRQRCRWRAVYREPYRDHHADRYDEAMAACG